MKSLNADGGMSIEEIAATTRNIENPSAIAPVMVRIQLYKLVIAITVRHFR